MNLAVRTMPDGTLYTIQILSLLPLWLSFVLVTMLSIRLVLVSAW